MDGEILAPAPKMERSYEKETDEALIHAQELATSGNLMAAIEHLMALEKKSRKASDVKSNTRILEQIVEMSYTASNWTILCEQLTTLSASHGQLDQAVSSMVKKAMGYVELAPEVDTQLEYISTLRKITEGKMLSEAERVQLTRRLSQIYEGQGKLELACEAMQEDQIETYGSLDKHTKVDFILEQMRMCLLVSDYSRMMIVSRKINVSYFAPANKPVSDSGPQSSEKDTIVVRHKLRYYDLMIKLGVHEEQYLEVSKYYHSLFTTPAIREDHVAWPKVLVRAVMFCVLAKHGNEQADLLHRYIKLEELDKLPQCADFAKLFTSKSLVVWTDLARNFSGLIHGDSDSTGAADASSNASKVSIRSVHEEVFSEGTETGKRHMQVVKDRVIEHNIRVVCKYYSRISLGRLSELVGLEAPATEAKLCSLVVDGSVYAKIDRPNQIINFVQPKTVSESLDVWVSNVNSLLSLVEKTNHLVEKENILYKITHSK